MDNKIKIHKYLLGPIETNTYLLECIGSRKAVVIDPAGISRTAEDYIHKNNLELVYIINTHGHFDHIGGNAFFYGISGGKALVAAHKLDFGLIRAGGGSSFYGFKIDASPEPGIDASEISEIEFGNTRLQFFYTPGHTPGHISVYEPESFSLFCGDVLFAGSVGRTDLPGGSQKDLLKSIKEKLYILPGITAVYPGHGDDTTIETEIRNNPWTLRLT